MTTNNEAIIKVDVDSSGVTSAMLKAVAITNMASRKFLVTIFMFTGSLMVAFIKPELVGDGNAQSLFTFWVMLAGVFFGGNVGEHLVKGKKQ